MEFGQLTLKSGRSDFHLFRLFGALSCLCWLKSWSSTSPLLMKIMWLNYLRPKLPRGVTVFFNCCSQDEEWTLNLSFHANMDEECLEMLGRNLAATSLLRQCSYQNWKVRPGRHNVATKIGVVRYNNHQFISKKTPVDMILCLFIEKEVNIKFRSSFFYCLELPTWRNELVVPCEKCQIKSFKLIWAGSFSNGL